MKRCVAVRLGEEGVAKSSQVKSGQVKSSQVRSSQVRSNQVRSSQAKSGQVKSGQVKSKFGASVVRLDKEGVAEAKLDGGDQNEEDDHAGGQPRDGLVREEVLDMLGPKEGQHLGRQDQCKTTMVEHHWMPLPSLLEQLVKRCWGK